MPSQSGNVRLASPPRGASEEINKPPAAAKIVIAAKCSVSTIGNTITARMTRIAATVSPATTANHLAFHHACFGLVVGVGGKLGSLPSTKRMAIPINPRANRLDLRLNSNGLCVPHQLMVGRLSWLERDPRHKLLSLCSVAS